MDYSEKIYQQNQDANISYGLYRGVVENNDDPYGIGRVQVRIPAFHGVPGITPTAIETDGLPWAPVCSLSAGAGRGTCIRPMIGDSVWILLEAGRKDMPVVMGSSYGIGNQPEGNKLMLSSSGLFQGKGYTVSSTRPQLPSDNDANQVLFKSAKGAEIFFNDEDGNESTNIIDRAGQTLRFKYEGEEKEKSAGPRGKGSRAMTTAMRDDHFVSGAHGSVTLQGTSTHGRDSKLVMTQDTTNLENGNSFVQMDKNTIKIGNVLIDQYLNEEQLKARNELEDPIRYQISINDDNLELRTSDCTILLEGSNKTGNLANTQPNAKGSTVSGKDESSPTEGTDTHPSDPSTGGTITIKNRGSEKGCSIKISGDNITITAGQEMLLKAAHIKLEADRIDLND